MPTHDATFARREILSEFANLPDLDFHLVSDDGKRLREPKLARAPELMREPSDTPVLSDKMHPALREVMETLVKGTEKLRYGHTGLESWDRYFRFASDRLRRDASGAYRIAPGSYDPASRYVNHTARRAHEWFTDELLAKLDRSRRAHFYLLGDPGAGKSTFMKYLISKHSGVLRQRRRIFSRFEFMKFLYRWRPTVDTLDERLADYVSFILLRDVLRTVAYLEVGNGMRNRVFGGPFRDTDTIAVLLKDAHFGERAPPSMPMWFDSAVEALHEALDDERVVHAKLLEVPYQARVSLIQHFARQWKITLVVDGLDSVSAEDAKFDAERHRILTALLKRRATLTNLPKPHAHSHPSGGMAPIDVSLIFVMRENTFYLNRDGLDGDHKTFAGRSFFLGPVDSSVAVHNAVSRASNEWAALKGESEEQARLRARRITRAIFTALRFIARSIGADQRRDAGMGAFAGNLRSLFRFMNLLLDWFIDEALRHNLLREIDDLTAENVLDVMTSPLGYPVLRQKNYRVIELLLFYETPWFEHAVISRQRDELEALLSEGPSAAPEMILQDNPYFTGFVDNIFNYASKEVAFATHDHPLLEKIRICQCLRERPLKLDDLRSRLWEDFAYRSPNLGITLIIMLRVQILRVLVTPDGLVLTPTSRGRFIADYLSRTLSYIEHVFHRTAFPEVLIRYVSDQPRESGGHSIDRWTAVSIRNAYIFLSYLRYVELHTRKPVKKTRRLLDPTRARIVHSISRILRSLEHAKPRLDDSGEPLESVASEALRLIQETRNHWAQNRCLREPERAGQH